MIWGPDEIQVKCNFVNDNFLHHCQDRTVLEVGCFEGWITEKIITNNPKKLILLEPHKNSADFVTEKFPEATVIQGDMHEDNDLKQVGKVDVVILLGVIYHSHAPLHALEKIVNICEPTIIILDNMQPFLDWKEETPNEPGMRNTVDKKLTSNIVISISNEITITAMKNLGYNLIKQDVYPEPSQGWGNPIFHFERT